MPVHTIITEKMVFGGDCIAKIDGKTVFIPFALPGETLEIEITRQNRDYDCARIVNIVTPSPHRVTPFCKYYGICGGCSLQHADSEYQKELRVQMLKSAFEREGITVSQIETVSASPTAYRSRFQFTGGGLKMKMSDKIVSLTECPCATNEINHYLKEVPIEKRPRGRVHVFGSDAICSIPEGFDRLIIAHEVSKAKPAAPKKEKRMQNGRPLPKQKQVKKQWTAGSLDPRNACTVMLCGKPVTFDVQGFFQSNLDVLQKAIPVVCEGLSGKHVLDMYAGCGTFSTFLAERFDMVTLVEHNRDALIYAEQNLANKMHESYGVSGGVWAENHAQSCIERNGLFDAVVIDPPRSGMEKEVCDWLCKHCIPKVRSISCDAATHARDIARLIKAGYRLEKLFLLDFYPQTAHIESLAYLSRDAE